MATRQKLAMCAHGPAKKCYPTRGAAIKAALAYSKKRGVGLRWYWHRDCRSYHLTRSRKW